MPCNPFRELSPKEETTLLKIARGGMRPDDLRSDDISTLQNFGFAQSEHGRLTLTPLGFQRFAKMARSTNCRH
jgi:hypothetical protein